MKLLQKIFGIRLSRKQSESYSYICSLLDTEPKNMGLYEQALTHRSASGKSNERLEYLGDSLLGMVVAEELFRRFPTEGEGFLTKARANVVCRENLNKIACRIGLDKHLHTGLKMKKNSENVYGNALEALVGAIYLDLGFDTVATFIRKVVAGGKGENLMRVSERNTDYKSRLLEYAQARHIKVEYVMIGERYELQDDRHVFLYEVRLDDVAQAQAAGYSKREAQQSVSRKVLKQLMNKK